MFDQDDRKMNDLARVSFKKETLLCKDGFMVYIVHAKYQTASVKALVHFDFPMQTLIKKKVSKFKTLLFCQKIVLCHQTSLCKCSMCLQFVLYSYIYGI